MSATVVIAAGGTAGHVYPGLALADAIRRTDANARVAFVGTSRGIEKDAVPAAGFPLHTIEVVPWARTLGAKRYLAPASLVGASGRARSLLRRLAPDIVVGMGGYASLPVVVGAWSKRIPALLHEQNAIPGIANVVGARLARRVALSFEEAETHLPSGAETRLTGNPIRRSIAELDRGRVRDQAYAALDLDPSRKTVLVLGGSLGAARLNDAVVELAERWKDRSDVQVLVSAGREHGTVLRARIRTSETLVVRVLDYLERVELAYAVADLAVCRAGAATIAELSAVGIPAILVPYPYARANHQEANARALERAGGARVILDSAATGSTLGHAVENLIADPAERDAMAAAAARFGRPHAADALAAWTLELAGANSG